MKYAVVDGAGSVINTVEWDGSADWSPPQGTTAVPDETGQVGPGWTYADGVFTAPPTPTPPELPPPTPTNEQQVIYDHENRIREIEGEPPLTLADFLTKMAGGK